jgi:hypothetical protein
MVSLHCFLNVDAEGSSLHLWTVGSCRHWCVSESNANASVWLLRLRVESFHGNVGIRRATQAGLRRRHEVRNFIRYIMVDMRKVGFRGRGAVCGAHDSCSGKVRELLAVAVAARRRMPHARGS